MIDKFPLDIIEQISKNLDVENINNLSLTSKSVSSNIKNYRKNIISELENLFEKHKFMRFKVNSTRIDIYLGKNLHKINYFDNNDIQFLFANKNNSDYILSNFNKFTSTTLLNESIRFGRLNILKFIIGDSCLKSKNFYLNVACENGQYSCLLYFLNMGCQILENRIDNLIKSCIRGGNFSCLNEIMKKYQKSDLLDYNYLHYSIDGERINMLEYFIEKFNLSNEDIYKLFIYSCKNGKYHMIKYFYINYKFDNYDYINILNLIYKSNDEKSIQFHRLNFPNGKYYYNQYLKYDKESYSDFKFLIDKFI